MVNSWQIERLNVFLLERRPNNTFQVCNQLTSSLLLSTHELPRQSVLLVYAVKPQPLALMSDGGKKQVQLHFRLLDASTDYCQKQANNSIGFKSEICRTLDVYSLDRLNLNEREKLG